jgi:hypothetical protein
MISKMYVGNVSTLAYNAQATSKNVNEGVNAYRDL